MDEAEQRCAKLSLEQRSLYLPTARCEVKDRFRTGEDGLTLMVKYSQAPGFIQREPYDTRIPVDDEITNIRYDTVSHHKIDVRVLIPSVQREDSGEFNKTASAGI